MHDDRVTGMNGKWKQLQNRQNKIKKDKTDNFKKYPWKRDK